ncbi:Protein YLS3 [Bienertia sinuspersici]
MAKLAAVVIAVAMVVLTTELAAAQSSGEAPSCASKLTACVNYLNATTTPPSTCCNPLKEAVTNERPCLCSIYNNPDLVKAFNINITQALNLPKLCHIDTGSSPDICKVKIEFNECL